MHSGKGANCDDAIRIFVLSRPSSIRFAYCDSYNLNRTACERKIMESLINGGRGSIVISERLDSLLIIFILMMMSTSTLYNTFLHIQWAVGRGGGVAEYGTISGISRPVWPVVISQSVSLVVHDTPSVHRDGRCVFSLFKLLIKVTCEF